METLILSKNDSSQNSCFEKNFEAETNVGFSISGMSCISCVNKVEAAVKNLPGVSRVSVDLSNQYATICYNSALIGPKDLRAAIEAVGYNAKETRSGIETDFTTPTKPVQIPTIGPYPFLIGVAAALAVVGFYLALLTLTSDWYDARMQFSQYRWWILALAGGLGVQATLFSFMRKRLRGGNLKAAKSGLAASGGMSTASMAACCAHYIVPLLPALGLPFLSAAAAGIAEHQTEFFLLGVLSNLVGLGIMLRLIQKNGILKIRHMAR